MPAYVPTPEKLRNLLAFDPDRGVLRYRSRPLSDFEGQTVQFRSPRDLQVWWNRRNAGREILPQRLRCPKELLRRNPRGNITPRVNIHGSTFPLDQLVYALHHGVWPVTCLNQDELREVFGSVPDGTLRAPCEHLCIYEYWSFSPCMKSPSCVYSVFLPNGSPKCFPFEGYFNTFEEAVGAQRAGIERLRRDAPFFLNHLQLPVPETC